MKTEESIRKEIENIDILIDCAVENLNKRFDIYTALIVHNLKQSKQELEWVLEE